MKVLILAKDAHIGGLVTSTASLARGLKQFKDVDSIIGMPIGSGVGFRMDGLRVEEINFDSKSPLAMIANFRKLCRIVKENGIQIIHCQNRIPALYASLYCFFHRKVKYIWVNHQVPIPCGLLHRLTTKYGYCAVTDCIAGESLLVDGLKIPKEKAKVINLGLDLTIYKKTSKEEQDALKEKYKINDDEKVIFLYARLDETKGHKFLLEALNKVSERNFRLVFPGESNDYKEEVIKLARQYGFEGKIIFPGFVKGNSFLSISDLMVLPSRRESFSYACVESFCVGVPVIRTTTGGYEDMKDLCWGVNYGDTDKLASLIESFFVDSKKYEEKAKYAQEHVSRFNISNMIDAYYQLYTEALK